MLLAASGCVHAISAWIVWSTRDADEARRTAIEKLCGGEDPKVRLWRDYIGSSDPVPGGALTDTARVAQPSAQDATVRQSGDAGCYEPVWLRNRRSMLLDHTAYPDNLEEYVAGLGMDLVAASLPDEPPPTLIDADTAARAQIARALRTLSMSMARLGSAAVAVAVLVALTLLDGASLQRLGARVPLADELRAAVNKVVGGDTLKSERAGELIGVAIALIAFAAAWLLVAAGWKVWDSKDRRLFMGRKPPVGVTSTTPITDLPAKEVGPRAIDAKFAAWWLVCLAAASALVLDLANQTARWWLPLPALVAGALLILLVPAIARWRDRTYKTAGPSERLRSPEEV